jgi:hypothetical protein
VTTGGGRVRVSAAFTATASGIKLPILVLIPRKTPLPNFQPPPNVCIIYKQSATFDQHVICQYLDTIIKPYMISKDFDKLAILLDSAKCHSTAPVMNKLKELNVLKVQIPARMTNLLQPADVCWFRTLKQKYYVLWNTWFLLGNHTFTRNDNARSPGYVKAVEWLSQIWEEFPSHINSFENCGIIGQYRLHNVLQKIVSTNANISEYADIRVPADNIDGFESEEDIFDENNLNEEQIVSGNIISHQEPNSSHGTTASNDQSQTIFPTISNTLSPVTVTNQLVQSINNASNEPTTYHIPPNYYAPPPQQPSNYQMPYNPTQYNAIQYNAPQYNAPHYNAPIQYSTPSQYNVSTQYIHQPPYNPYMTNYQYYVPQASQ